MSILKLNSLTFLRITFIFMCPIIIQCSDFKVSTSLTNSGDYSGGIRYVVSSQEVDDFGLTYDESQENASPGYWVDYYYGLFGGMISAPSNQSPTYSLMFSTEGQLSSSVGVGIGVRMLDVQKNRKAKVFSTWDAYLVIPI